MSCEEVDELLDYRASRSRITRRDYKLSIQRRTWEYIMSTELGIHHDVW